MQARPTCARTGSSIVALALAGCPNADDRYQDFVDWVIDAGPTDQVDGMMMSTLPDVDTLPDPVASCDH